VGISPSFCSVLSWAQLLLRRIHLPDRPAWSARTDARDPACDRPPFADPVSQLALQVLNYLVMRLLPPRALPKMDFEVSGIPDAFRTLVVVPVLLGNAETTRAEVEKLEIRYLANKEDNLLFSLFTDYTDSDQAHREDDERLLQDCDREPRSSQPSVWW